MDGSNRPVAPNAANIKSDSAVYRAARPCASQIAFAVMLMGLGVIGLIYGDFAMVWQRIPVDHVPGRTFLAYAAAAIELICGLGLLVPRMTRISSRILFVFFLIWVLLLKLPAVVAVPQMEATWLGFGEIAVILAGDWILFAIHAGAWERSHLRFGVGASGVRLARVLFALSLPMIGLSHFFYTAQTAAMVPAWLPDHAAWAYLTGAGNILAGLGVLFAIFPRLAATAEAAMLGIITLLVWGPGFVTKPTDRLQVTAFLISAVIACGAWIVADSYRDTPWLAVGAAAKKTSIS